MVVDTKFKLMFSFLVIMKLKGLIHRRLIKVSSIDTPNGQNFLLGGIHRYQS